MSTEASGPDQLHLKPESGKNLFGTMLGMAAMIEALAYHAEHDDLTGLLTKAAVKRQAEERREAGKAFGILLLDWDAFKVVNDTLGHEKADRMLEEFGPYMSRHFRREGDAFAHEKSIRDPQARHDLEYVFGRYGGDEFLGVVNLSDRKKPDGLTPKERMKKAEAYASDVLVGFVEQQSQDVRDLRYGISIGGDMWEPGNPRTVSDVVHGADLSMLANKKAHGAPVR